MNKILRKRRPHNTSFQTIILSFLALILIGTLLLMLPIASRERTVTRLSDAVFTAVSATCVTGLVVQDTASHWSLFGQCVILTLIQIGGMGVITIGLAVMRVTGRKIGLGHRSTMQEAISAPNVGGIVRLTSFILTGSAIIEAIGAVLLAPGFCRDFGVPKGIWYAVFHSVSAFCNAGFDLMGARAPFSSMCTYSGNTMLNIVLMALIVIGGIGFLTWSDVRQYRFHLRRYSLQSKIVLLTSLLLIVLPAVYFFVVTYADLPARERILSALFQSVTARTAGFNTQDLSQMDESGSLLMTMLMLVGGSPGSTAGGMKTATIAVLLLSALTVFSRRNDVQCFNRRLPEETVRNAGAILFMYLTLFFVSGALLCRIEGLPLRTCLFETASAIGTVGLTMGITTGLSTASRVILMLLMFFGRVGGLTLIYAAVPSAESQSARLPQEKITVG